MRPYLVVLPVAALCWSAMAVAQTSETAAPAPPPVDPAGPDDPVEPDITIVQQEDRVLYEYRDNNGRLLMVKVVPTKGRPYYLLDTDGDGELDVKQWDPRSVAVQMWEIFRW